MKGTSVVISTVFGIDWRVATVVGIVCVLTYSYFGGLWTSVMTGTLNTLMITVPAAIVVAAVFAKIPGGPRPSTMQPPPPTPGTFLCCGRTPPLASASRWPSDS